MAKSDILGATIGTCAGRNIRQCFQHLTFRDSDHEVQAATQLSPLKIKDTGFGLHMKHDPI